MILFSYYLGLEASPSCDSSSSQHRGSQRRKEKKQRETQSGDSEDTNEKQNRRSTLKRKGITIQPKSYLLIVI